VRCASISLSRKGDERSQTQQRRCPAAGQAAFIAK
jgi:hypothetical protein